MPLHSVLEKTLESPFDCKEIQSILKEISPEYSLEGLIWSWNSNTLATWCEELTHWKRPWCWERLKVGGEGDNREWDSWTESLTQWTWVWVNSGSSWWTGRPGMPQFTGNKQLDVTERLNWTVLTFISMSGTFHDIRRQKAKSLMLLKTVLFSIHTFPHFIPVFCLRWGNFCCCSVTQLCPTPYDPMDCSSPGFPFHHQLLEPTQTHVHRISDSIQPSHPLPSPSHPDFSLSQHQGLFKWVHSLHQMAKVWSFSLSVCPSNEYSELISISIDWFDVLAVLGLSRVFSNITGQKHQFFSTQPSLWSNSHIHTWLLEKP